MRGAAVDASRRVQAAMKMDHCLATCSLMEVVHVLRDDRQLGYVLGELCDRMVGTVGLRLDDLAPTPFVPPPTQA